MYWPPSCAKYLYQISVHSWILFLSGPILLNACNSKSEKPVTQSIIWLKTKYSSSFATFDGNKQCLEPGLGASYTDRQHTLILLLPNVPWNLQVLSSAQILHCCKEWVLIDKNIIGHLVDTTVVRYMQTWGRRDAESWRYTLQISYR